MRTAFTDLLGVRHPIAGFNRSPAVGSPTRTGKPARQLRSAWHDEWERPGSPPPLPLPLPPMLVSEAWHRIDAAADAGHEGALKLESFFVGQVVGSFSRLRPAAEITRQIIGDCEVRLAELAALLPAGAPAAP
jgi:NAD(P)H-dependent flavin oxidoreductase YrpB (nitropropane dioxygenase family)